MGVLARSLTLLSSAFLLFSTIFFFGPLHVYFANVASFPVPPAYHALTGLALAAAATALAAAALLLPHRGYAAFVTATLAAGVGLWLQGNIMVWQYGPMDGSPIDWSSRWVYGAVDGTVWLLLAAGAVRYSGFLLRKARPIAMSLLLIQAVSLGILVHRTNELGLPEKIQVDERGKFDLSTTRNVILLIFDEFQGDVFSELLDRDPGLKEVFDGFVYFPDTVAGASFTEIAVPFLLTGELYDNSVPWNDFLKRAFTRQAIPKLLHDRGFDAELYPWGILANAAVYRAEGIADNFRRHIPSPGFRSELREYALLLDVAMFRHAPHALKRHLYDQGAWGWKQPAAGKGSQEPGAVSTDNNPLLLQLTRESRATKKSPVFKGYHFTGAHVPLHDIGGTGQTMEYNRSNYTKVYAHLLAQAGNYLERLKELGVYDETMIFICGDHGSGRSPDMWVPPLIQGPGSGEERSADSGDSFPLWKARGLPLLLAKNFKARGELRVSNAPASLGDLPKTIGRAVGADLPLPGYELFALPEDAVRTRAYASFKWSRKSSDYVSPMTLYSISGPAWLDQSWKVEKILLPPRP